MENSITEKEGDLLNMLDQFDVVLQGCNAFHTFGAGIARQFRERFPQTYEADLTTKFGDIDKVGTYSKSKVGSTDVLNCYTQYAYGTHSIQFDYNAFRRVLKSVKSEYPGKRIGMPMIGAGLAGGNWNDIMSIIKEELPGESVTIIKYKQ